MARRMLGEPSRLWTSAPPLLYTAAAVRSAVTTVAASPTPRKIRAGVIRAPPPIPVRPTTIPTKKPAARIEKKVAAIRPLMRRDLTSIQVVQLKRRAAAPGAFGRSPRRPPGLDHTGRVRRARGRRCRDAP